MKRTARILGLVALVAIPLAYVALGLYPQDGSPAPTAAEMGAAIAAELGVEVPAETVEAIGARVMLTPDEANLGTAPALGEAIVELAGLPETVDPEALGETALAVADQLGRAGRGEVGWGPTLASIAALFLALVGMFFGWERKAKVATVACVLGLGLVLGGCGSVRVTTGGPDWHDTIDLGIAAAVNIAVHELGEDQRRMVEDTAWTCAPLAHTAVDQAMSGTVVLDPLIAEFGACLSASLADIPVGKLVVDLVVPAVRAGVYGAARAAGLPEG